MTNNQQYEFEKREDGNVVGTPKGPNKSEVILPPEIANSDDESKEAGWEPLMEDIATSELGGDLNPGSGQVTVSREDAVTALLDGDNEYVASESLAHATIDYLVSEDVFDTDGDQLVVLIPLEQVQEGRWSYGYNWAATLEGLQDRIDSAMQTVEEAQERVDFDITSEELISSLKNKGREAANKLANMCETPGLPSSDEVAQMSDTQRRIYTRRSLRLEKLQQHIESLEEQEEAGLEELLGEVMIDLETTGDVMEFRGQTIRSRTAARRSFPDDVFELADNLTAVVTAVDGLEGIDGDPDPDEIQAIATNFIDVSAQVQQPQGQPQSQPQDQSQSQSQSQ